MSTKDPESPDDGEVIELSPDDLNEIPEISLEDRTEWQRQESISGEMDDFSDNFIVAYEMRKDMQKRPGETPGEDMILADPETGLTGVFDGLGGMGSGDKASAMAAHKLPEIYKKQSAEMTCNTDVSRYRDEFFAGQKKLQHPSLQESAGKALEQMWNQLPDNVRREMLALYTSAKELSSEVAKTKGLTTMTVGKTIEMPDGKAYEITVNVGDSGAMKLRADGTASELTVEDSALRDALSAGYLTIEEAKDPNHVIMIDGKIAMDPSAKEGEESRPMTVKLLRRGMSQSLGQHGGVEPRVTVNLIREGEKVIYMSDGIRDEILGEDGFFDADKARKFTDPAASALENAKALNSEAMKGSKRDEKAVVVKERIHSL